MPWLLSVHIVFLLIWCAALFYLPGLIAGRAGGDRDLSSRGHGLPVRQLFNLLATPAALFTIASGTLLFLVQGTLGIWLILKLTAVLVMVVCHALYGALILRLEREPQTVVSSLCVALAVTSALAVLCVVWLVLARPL